MGLLLGVLAACGNNEDSETGNNETSTGENAAPENPEDFEGDLEIWTFFGDVEKMAAKFEESYPNVNVNVSVFPGDQYQTKIMNAINTRTDVPDIFDLERGYMGKFINHDFVANLSEMGADELLEDYVPYVRELGVGEDGSIRAVSDHSSPGAFWYHRDLALEYLGTDDPAEVSEMVDSWEKIIELGKKINDETNGEIQLLSHFGDVYNIEKSNQEAWVQDGKLVIDEQWEQIFDWMVQTRAEGVEAKLGYFSGGWGDALNNSEVGVIMFANPAWAGFMVGNDEGQADGRYGLATTPSGYYDGGTYRAVYQDSENKDLAYEFIKFIASEEWQVYNLEETGNMPALQSIFDSQADDFTHSFFGDQKVLSVYKDQVMDIPAVKADENNNEITTLWYDAAAEAIDNNEDYDQVINDFKAMVKNGYPSIEVE